MVGVDEAGKGQGLRFLNKTGSVVSRNGSANFLMLVQLIEQCMFWGK